MTESLLLKVEEKVMTLITELEDVRNELNRVKQENSLLKADKANHTQKLQGIVSLLEAFDANDSASSVVHEHAFGRLEEVASL